MGVGSYTFLTPVHPAPKLYFATARTDVLRLFSTATALLLLTSCGLDQFENELNPIDDTHVWEADADTDADADGDADVDKEPIEISSITPAYGTTGGGTELTIIGGPFDNSATVRFGGNAGLVQSAQTNVLQVVTPSLPSPGQVDVEVTTNTGYGALTAGFTVMQDGTGLAGSFGEMAWENYVGGYWSSGSPPTPEGWVSVGLLSPGDFSYTEFWAPSMGSCGNNYTYQGTAQLIDIGDSNVTLSSGSANVSLNWDGDSGQWCSGTSCNPTTNIGSLASSDYRSSSSYELTSVNPTNGWPEFTVPEFLRTPTSISVSNPAITGSSLPLFSRTQSFNWTATDADYVIIRLWLLNANMDAIEQDITCVTPNSGYFQLPSNAWTSFPTGRIVHVLVGAVKEANGRLPSGASSQAVGINWVHGGGQTY